MSNLPAPWPRRKVCNRRNLVIAGPINVRSNPPHPAGVLQCLRMAPQQLQRAPLESVVIRGHEDVLNGRGRPIRRNFARQLPDFPQHLAHRAAVLDHRIVVADLKRIEPAAAMAVEDGTEVLQYRDALLGRQLSEIARTSSAGGSIF